MASKNSNMSCGQKLVSRKREPSNTKLQILRSPNSSPSRPVVIVPPIKRIKNCENFAEHKKTETKTKPGNVEKKQLKVADKIAEPFAMISSLDSYVHLKNGMFSKPFGDNFAQKRKIAQVEPFKVFDEYQPLDLTVKKEKVVTENIKVPISKLNHQTGEHLKTREFKY